MILIHLYIYISHLSKQKTSVLDISRFVLEHPDLEHPEFLHLVQNELHCHFKQTTSILLYLSLHVLAHTNLPLARRSTDVSCVKARTILD